MQAIRITRVLTSLLLLIFASSCRTPKPVRMDLSGPDWHTRQGQALWRSKKDAPEIVGEVVIGTNSTGRAFLQFLKNPLPLVTVENSPDYWRVEFVPEQRSFSGASTPPVQLTWLHLLRALQEIKPPKRLVFAKTDAGEIRMEDNITGERISLFLEKR